jgi:hypothetical protein
VGCAKARPAAGRTDEEISMALEGRTALGELEGNELAVSTMAVVDRIRPHAGLITLTIVVMFAVLAGVILVRSQQTAEQAAAWEATIGAMTDGDPARLQEVTARYRGTPAGWWAELVLADNALADGNRLLLVDQAQAQARLAAAAELYASVNAQRPTAVAAERGIFGLARTRESQGKLEEARRGYEALVAEYPTSPFKPLAEARLAALSRPATQRWYKWFETTPAVPAPPAAEPASDKPVESAAESSTESGGPAAAPTGEPAGEPPAR